MSLHNWKEHWQAWLLDIDLKPLAYLNDLVGVAANWEIRDKCDFTASLPMTSDNYSQLDINDDTDQFLLLSPREGRWQIFAIESIEPSWKMQNGRRQRVVNLAGTGGCLYVLGSRVVQPDPSGTAWTDSISGQAADDAIKDLVRNHLTSGGHADPDSNSRAFPGLSVAANTSAGTVISAFERKPDNLWDVARALCLDYNVDMTITPVWNGADAAVTLVFDAIAGGRGSSDAVIMSDKLLSFSESTWHVDKHGRKTHVIDQDGHAIQAADDAASHIRREAWVDTQDADDLRRALDSNATKKGHTFKYRETLACQIGTDVWIGDTVTHTDSVVGAPATSELLTGIKWSIQTDDLGSEQVEVLFGDAKPDAARDRGENGGGGGSGGGRQRGVPGATSTNTAKPGTGLEEANGTINLADTAVTPGTYGDGDNAAQVTIDQQGRITSATEVAIATQNHTHPITGDTGGNTASVSGNTASTQPTLSGKTTSWTAVAVIGSIPVKGGGSYSHVYLSTDGGTTNSWVALNNTDGLYIDSSSHYHNLSGTVHSVSADAAVSSHQHAAGSLSVASHTHPAGTLATSNPA